MLERKSVKAPHVPASKQHSGTPGVTFRRDRKSKPWRARIQVDKKTYYLGCFETEAEAAKVAKDAYIQIYGREPRVHKK